METRRGLDDGPAEGQAKEQSSTSDSASESTHDGSALSASQPAWIPGKDDVRAADYQEETPTNYITLNIFEDFTAHLKARICRVCQEPFFSSELDIRRLFQDWADGVVDQLSCNVRCSSCNTRSCIACEPEPFARSSRIVSQSSKRYVSWCCVGGRLFLIWALLCGFDRHIWESRNVGKISKQSEAGPKSRKNANKATRGGSVGLGGGHRPSTGHMPSGMGYGGHGYHMYEDTDFEDDIDDNEDGGDFADMQYTLDKAKGPGHNLDLEKSATSRPKKEDKVSKAQNAQISEDAFSGMVLGFLTDLLPSLERETCFDFDPPKAVLEMLTNSKILQYCAELLRNDSLIDVTKRKNLYQTLFIFLMTMGSHSETSAALFGPRFVHPEMVDLLTLSFCAAVPDLRDNVSILAGCLRNLTTQSSMVLQSAKNNEEDFKNQEGQDMLWICHKISILSQYIKDNSATITDGDKGKETAVVLEDLTVGEVEEKLMKQNHRYYKQAKELEASRPGRFKRLVTEITTLQTGLPPGIFIRYCENRPDILKCIIIGPVGTPYENGLFEFDFFCDAEYPKNPPQVNFKGTAGGCISINPNLYADGKVCLSLLGTWSGEPWNAGESTLLQVLISIQAMILCEEPWYNEPGREAGYTRSPNSPSAKYNKKIREHTVRTAILAWLDKPPLLWKDVVNHHFREHGNAILKTVEEWTKEKATGANKSRSEISYTDEFYDYDEAFAAALTANGRTLSSDDMGTMLFKLQPALKEYGVTFEVTYLAPTEQITSPAPKAPRKHSWSPHQLPPLVSGASSSGAPQPGFVSPPPPPPPSYDYNALIGMNNTIGIFQQQAAAAATVGRGGYTMGQGRGAFSGGHNVVGNTSYSSGGSPVTSNIQGESGIGGSSEAPRYGLRSATRGGRGDDGSNASTRGGRGNFPYSVSPLTSGAGANMGRGRGDTTLGRGGFGRGRGRGRGDGDAQGGLTTTFAPFFPSTPANFGRGRGTPPPGDNFTVGDAPPWTRGGGFANGRGGRGERGGRGGRGRGRGDRGHSGP